ncbi:hypothetical protein O3M35_001136 [Rhynocoris fuscipes]|uniref:BTB domain-containing protein n=1 Tax=Rhynocoris fuscipes TaxID=488301 RepID=A0AAW1DTA6_9HEMI
MKLYQPINLSDWDALKDLDKTPWNKCKLIYAHRGGQSFLLVHTNGDLYGFGENKYRLFGNIDQLFITHPLKINITNVIALDTGYFHVVALLGNGDLYTWGLNNYGQLGNGNQQPIIFPSKVDISEEIINISCGYFCTLAVDKNQTVWFWGCLNEVPLSTQSELQPIQVMCGQTVINIACGGRHAAILTADKLYVCGSNENGQLAKTNINVAYYYQPVLNLPENLSDVVCGAFSTAVLTTDGKVFCWGDLGNTEQYDPVKFCFREKVIEISANGDDDIFYAILENHEVYHWGHDVYRLGHDNNCYYPQKIEVLSNFDMYSKRSKTPAVYCTSCLPPLVPFNQEHTVSEKIALLFNNKTYSDLKIKLNGDEIMYAHKLIITLNSSTFSRIILNNFKSKKTIDLTKYDSVAVKSYIKFLYTNKLENVHVSHLPELYNFAKKDEKSNLQNQILLTWKNSLNEKDIATMFKKAYYHQCEDLIELCLPMTKRVTIDKVDSLNLTPEILFQIIESSVNIEE